MKDGHNSRSRWAAALTALALPLFPALLPAQVSLATVVDLAQRKSEPVRLAQADVDKATAVLRETRDVFIPAIEFGSGLPAAPSVGFTGGVPSILNGTVQSVVFSMPQIEYVRAARAGVAAAQLSLKDAKEQVALDASTAYIELVTVDRELDAVDAQQSMAARLVTIEQDRTEAGVDPLSTLLDAQLTAAELRLKRLQLETRAATLAKQLAVLTGLPNGSIRPDPASIPEIPAVRAYDTPHSNRGIEAARMQAASKQKLARGAFFNEFLPLVTFNALYSRNTTILNDFNSYYKKSIPTNNVTSGFSIQLPIFDASRGAKERESAADALRATVEAEQAERQSDIQIVTLTGSLRELDALAEIASLKQQIAQEQLKTVLTQLEVGNGATGTPGAPPQLTPKAEQLARIEERQRYSDSLDAGLDLDKTRLSLLRALGHMDDWLCELH